MWSKESIMSIPCPGSLFPQSVIANLEHLDDQERKRRRPWNNKEHLKNKRMKKGGKQEEKKGRRTDSLNQEDIYGIQNWFYNVYNILQLIWI